MDDAPKVGQYRWIGPFEYEVDSEPYMDMISPHTRSNLLSDMPIEDFVHGSWNVDDPEHLDSQDFIEFWRRVRLYERGRL